MINVERHFHKGNDAIIDLCKLSKELYNKCNYLMRKAWFGKVQLPNIKTLYHAIKYQPCYRDFHNTKTAKQTVWQVLEDWKNFKKALKAWKICPSKFTGEPKPPNYKNKLAQVIFDKETISDGRSKKLLTKITPTNKCFSIPSTRKFKQVVITPKTFGFVIDVQYEVEPKPKTNKESICCIDIGMNNLATITSDQHKPILINGRIVKSINQWFNKKQNKYASKKRYWRLENYFHHVSKMIIANCIKHNIGKIIIGKNNGWKSNLKLNSKTKQNFQYIPFVKLFQKIEYKAELAGIEVIFTEEAYTSKASFIDKDPLPVYEKGVTHTFSGKRIKRGLYKSKNGIIINADVNGSANIGRKVIENSDLIAKLDRSVGATPVRINPLKFFCV